MRRSHRFGTRFSIAAQQLTETWRMGTNPAVVRQAGQPERLSHLIDRRKAPASHQGQGGANVKFRASADSKTTSNQLQKTPSWLLEI
jgi:hypothetical protein